MIFPVQNARTWKNDKIQIETNNLYLFGLRTRCIILQQDCFVKKTHIKRFGGEGGKRIISPVILITGG